MKETNTTYKDRYHFYLSFWESYKQLKTNAEKVEFIEIINKVHFFEEHIDNIKPKNTNVKLLFTSIKHSLWASVKGFCDKKQIEYNQLFNTPCEGGIEGGIEGGMQPPCQQYTINNKQYTINNKKEEMIPFEDFYSLYPVKKSKAKAEQYWNKLSKDIQQECIDVLNSPDYNNWLEEQDKKYVKHPSTWLNQKCWEDELEYETNKIDLPWR